MALGARAVHGLFCSRFVLPVLETLTLLLAAASLFAGWMPPLQIGLLLTAIIFFQILVTMTTVIVEPLAAGSAARPGEMIALFIAAVPENLGLRQWRNLGMIRHFVSAFRAAPAIQAKEGRP
jgi:hypothetical protein